MAIFSFLSCIFLFFTLVKSKCKAEVKDLTILNDYCGHIRRHLTTKITEKNKNVFPMFDIDETVESVDQVIGLYDVCMQKRNSYQYQDFPHM